MNGGAGSACLSQGLSEHINKQTREQILACIAMQCTSTCTYVAVQDMHCTSWQSKPPGDYGDLHLCTDASLLQTIDRKALHAFKTETTMRPRGCWPGSQNSVAAADDIIKCHQVTYRRHHGVYDVHMKSRIHCIMHPLHIGSESFHYYCH